MATKQSEAQRRYDDAHTKRFFMKLNTNYDADIIEKLDTVGNKQGYIKDLIRRDINDKRI